MFNVSSDDGKLPPVPADGTLAWIFTFTRRPQSPDTMGMRLVAYAKPVHKLPSHLPPVQSCMDVHGDPAGQPEQVGKTGEGPVPAVQGTRGNGGEECTVSCRTWSPCGAVWKTVLNS